MESRKCVCLNPACEETDLYSRGLYRRCYASARNLMRAGRVTENELVSAGVMAPNTYDRSGPRSEFSRAFLAAVKK